MSQLPLPAKLSRNAAHMALVVFAGLTMIWTSQAQASGLGSSIVSDGRKTVLLTSFLPWSNRTVNNSMLVTDRLAPLLRNRGFNVQVCTVPVIWDKSALAAIDCFREMPVKPDLVVSFGEGGSEHIAMGARNKNNTVKDDTGAERPSDKIDRNLPKYLDFSLPGSVSFKDALKSAGVKFELKKNPGSYICNNISFRLQNYLEPQGVPFFFTHVLAIQPKDLKTSLTPEREAEYADARAKAATETARKSAILIETLLTRF